MQTRLTLGLTLALTACSSPPPAAIEPGVGIGEVRVGDRWEALDPSIAEGARPLVFDRLAYVERADLGLEVVLASSEDETISADARVIGVATTSEAPTGVVHVGASRADVASALGAPTESVGDVDFWAAGVSVTWDADRAVRVAVFAPYDDAAIPPPMQPALGGTP